MQQCENPKPRNFAEAFETKAEIQEKVPCETEDEAVVSLSNIR